MADLFKVRDEDAVRVGADDLRRTVATILERVNVPAEDAALAADVLVTADVRGVDSHGVSNMLRDYVARYRDGRINPRPDWKVVRERASTATIDCDGGIGIIIGPKAMDIAVRKARQTGMGVVTMGNGRHMGMASYHAMLALRHDMIGMCMTAVAPQVLPTFGRELRLGTNPIAVAAPAKVMHPFVFDAATSMVPINKLRIAERLGTVLPAGWIADGSGRPLTEPGPLPKDYKLLPFGGTREMGSHKAYGLAMVVDILCSLLAGVAPGALAGRGPANHFVAAYDIDAFTDVDIFKETMDDWLRLMEATPPAPGYDRVLTPGQLEYETEMERRAKGIPLHPEVVQWFEATCREMGIPIGFSSR